MAAWLCVQLAKYVSDIDYFDVWLFKVPFYGHHKQADVMMATFRTTVSGPDKPEPYLSKLPCCAYYVCGDRRENSIFPVAQQTYPCKGNDLFSVHFPYKSLSHLCQYPLKSRISGHQLVLSLVFTQILILKTLMSKVNLNN